MLQAGTASDGNGVTGAQPAAFRSGYEETGGKKYIFSVKISTYVPGVAVFSSSSKSFLQLQAAARISS